MNPDHFHAADCPWCGEPLELFVDPDAAASYIEDCQVCCRPIRIEVHVTDGCGREAFSLMLSPDE